MKGLVDSGGQYWSIVVSGGDQYWTIEPVVSIGVVTCFSGYAF